MARSDAGVEERVNRLYWESERSVNEIADALELSKGRLYEMIRPLAAGLYCPRCGGELVHTNRTAHDRGVFTCSGCGASGEEEELLQGGEQESDLWVGSSDTPAGADSTPALWRPSSGRLGGRLVVGGLLVGITLGALLVGYLRKR